MYLRACLSPLRSGGVGILDLTPAEVESNLELQQPQAGEVFCVCVCVWRCVLFTPIRLSPQLPALSRSRPPPFHLIFRTGAKLNSSPEIETKGGG